MSKVTFGELLEMDLKDFKDQFGEIVREKPKFKLKHSEVPDYLIDKLEEVNFNSEVKHYSSDEKITIKHYQIICVDELLQAVQREGYGLCCHNDFVYLYNGEYWSRFQNCAFEKFISNAAIKMGVSPFQAGHFSFIEQLSKQFMFAAARPEIEEIKKSNDKVLINLQNGTFEVDGSKMGLREHDREDFLTYQLPFAYDENAVCPIFDEYINTVLPDKSAQKVLAEYSGYLFVKTSRLKLEKALILYGAGANGKSVFFEILNALLGGNANVSNFSLQNLTNESGYYRAMLGGKLVNYSSEINGKLDEAVFKQLVSGEPVDARLPYGEPFTVTNYGKMIFNCNELPITADHTNAFFRRFLIIPFNVSIPEEEQDKHLANKIIANELPGVLNWVLEGLKRLLSQKRFTDSSAVENSLMNYQRESDSVALFIDEMGYETSATSFVAVSNIYKEYQRFCINGNFFAVTMKNFANRLRNLGYIVVRRNFGMAVNLKDVEKNATLPTPPTLL